MPEPVTSAPTLLPSVADAIASGTPFAEQLRAAAPHETVSLGAMVGAYATGLTPTVAATRASVGLGAMGAAAGPGTTAVTAVRAKTAAEQQTDTVVRFALAQQGKPYVWATKGPDTFDCSGLMTAAYKQIGVDIPAYTFSQAKYGREVDPKTEPLKPGDLIFVRGGRPSQDLGHVGMAISATEWILAPRTGDVVKVGPLPYERIQVVRRLVGS